MTHSLPPLFPHSSSFPSLLQLHTLSLHSFLSLFHSSCLTFMATLNPEAPEFIHEDTNVITPYTQNPYYHPILPSPTWYPTPYFSRFTFMETLPYFFFQYNSSIIYVGPEWYLNNLPPISPILPSLPSPIPPPHQEQQHMVVRRPRGVGGDIGAAKRVVKGRKEGVKKMGKAKWGSGLVLSSVTESKRSGFGPIDPHSTKTTVMIRNIPNKYTRAMLLHSLDEHCFKENQKLTTKSEDSNPTEDEDEDFFPSAYDFVYLPMDFSTKSNMGYAFVNFTRPKAAWKLSLSWHKKPWDLFNSKKICEITYAILQGKDALVKHFENTTFMCEEEEFLPVYFNPYRDGSGSRSVKQCTVGRRTKNMY